MQFGVKCVDSINKVLNNFVSVGSAVSELGEVSMDNSNQGSNGKTTYLLSGVAV